MAYYYGWHSTNRERLESILIEGFRVSVEGRGITGVSGRGEQHSGGSAAFGMGVYFSKNKIASMMEALRYSDETRSRRCLLLNRPFPSFELLEEIPCRLGNEIFIYCKFNIENLFHFDELNGVIYSREPYSMTGLGHGDIDSVCQRLGFDGILAVRIGTYEEMYVVRNPQNICIIRVEDVMDNVIWPS